MKYLTLILVILVSVLSGCATPLPVTVVRTEVIAPSDSSLINCTIAEPPDRETYVTLPGDQRELVLRNKLIDSYQSLNECNKRLTGLREWKRKTTAMYADKEDTIDPKETEE